MPRPRRRLLSLALVATPLLLPAPVPAQSAPEPSTAPKSAGSAPAVKTISLPLRQITLYKNGVALFERSGEVEGDVAVRIDCTPAQLNDVLQSLTATDSGNGVLTGAGFDSVQTVRQQLGELGVKLGPDPALLDLIHALKGMRVAIGGNGHTLVGTLATVETSRLRDPKTGVLVEHRMVSVLTDSGALRSVELTPAVEVRLLNKAQNAEIGRYLQLLATAPNDAVRHLTLVDQGHGKRTLSIRYLSAVPAWKSSYRVLLTPGDARTATLQGFAVIDNTSGTDWNDVQLNLVSGAPQSFIQQMARPNDIARQAVGFDGIAVPAQPRSVDPIPPDRRQTVPIDALALGGGLGAQWQATPPAAAGGVAAEAKRSPAPQATAVDLDELFEYKLDKPATIAAGRSVLIPLLQTPIEVERVSLWRGRAGQGTVERALWLRNPSKLLLDQGSVSLSEDGIFGGEGQIPVLHPEERSLVAYGLDAAVTVEGSTAKDPPAILRHVVATGGTLSLHFEFYKERDFVVENSAASPRTVVLEIPQTNRAGAALSPNITAAIPTKLSSLGNAGPWTLSNKTPATEVLDAGPARGGETYRFTVQVAPRSRQTLQVLERHSHPYHHSLRDLRISMLEEVIRQSGDNPGIAAQLKPLIDARRQLEEVNRQVMTNQTATDAATREEQRIRENIASLKGTAEEKPLAKRYADSMLAQEDKLAALGSERDTLTKRQSELQKSVDDRLATLKLDTTWPEVAVARGSAGN